MQEQIIFERFDKLERLINQPNISQKKALTLREAAKYTGRSLSNIYKLTSAGEIPHSKPEGKLIYFDREELEKWMLKNPVKTTEQIEQTASTMVTLNKKGVSK